MFEEIDLTINYHVNNKHHTVSLREGGNDDVGFAVSKYQDRLKIELLTEQKCVIDSAVLKTGYYYAPHYRVYCGAKYAGYSEETNVAPNRKKKLLKLINSSTMVKVPLKNLTSWSYTYVRDRDKYTLVGSMDEVSTFTQIVHRPELRRMIFTRTYGGGLLIPAEYTVFDLFFAEGSYNQVFDAYFSTLYPSYTPKKLLKEYTARSEKRNPITQELFREKLSIATAYETKFDLFLIEDYQKEMGDWLTLDQARFPDMTLEGLCQEILASGMQAGITLSPFEVVPNTAAATNLKKLLEKDDLNITIMRKGIFHLDVNNPEVRDYLLDLFSSLKTMGFSVFKIEGIMSTIYGKQEARKAHEIISLLREAIGDATFIVTDAPIISAAGIADYCRVSGQVTNSWKGNVFSRIFRRHNSARGTVRSMVARRHLDGRVFRNYPVRVHYAMDASHLTPEMKSILLIVTHFFSGALVASDNLAEYSQDLKNLFAQMGDDNAVDVNRINVPRKNSIEIEYFVDGKKKLFCFDLKNGKILYRI